MVLPRSSFSLYSAWNSKVPSPEAYSSFFSSISTTLLFEWHLFSTAMPCQHVNKRLLESTSNKQLVIMGLAILLQPLIPFMLLFNDSIPKSLKCKLSKNNVTCESPATTSAWNCWNYPCNLDKHNSFIHTAKLYIIYHFKNHFFSL